MKKKRKYGWHASYSVPLSSHSIDILGAETLFLEEDSKNRISISHLLEGIWNFKILVV